MKLSIPLAGLAFEHEPGLPDLEAWDITAISVDKVSSRKGLIWYASTAELPAVLWSLDVRSQALQLVL